MLRLLGFTGMCLKYHSCFAIVLSKHLSLFGYEGEHHTSHNLYERVGATARIVRGSVWDREISRRCSQLNVCLPNSLESVVPISTRQTFCITFEGLCLTYGYPNRCACPPLLHRRCFEVGTAVILVHAGNAHLEVYFTRLRADAQASQLLSNTLCAAFPSGC